VLDRFARSRLFPACLFLFALTLIELHGNQGRLGRDPAIYMYSARAMAEGVPPYVSIFDHKGPLSLMLAWPAAAIARAAGGDDLLFARVSFAVVGAVCVCALFALARRLLGSEAAALSAALVLLAIPGLREQTAAGPHPKTPMICFQVLALLCAAQRRWWLAGACSSAAGFVWQPMALYALAAALAALLQPRAQRLRAVTRSAAGIASVGLAVAGYFAAKGALAAAFDGAVTFNLAYLERDARRTGEHLELVAASALDACGLWTLPVLIGLAAHPALLLWRRRLAGSWRALLERDPWAAALLAFPAPFLWSLFDFQGEADTFVFLPHAALGFAFVLHVLTSRLRAGPPLAWAAAGLLACACVIGAARDEPESPTIDVQRRRLLAALEQADPPRPPQSLEVQSLGAPQTMVLLRRTGWSRFLFVVYGIDDYIEAREPGGFRGWLDRFAASDPDVVLMGRTTGRRSREFFGWLDERYDHNAGRTLYIRKRRPAPASGG
jgi:hypothetical protein